VVGVATFGSVDPNTGREVAGLNFAVPVSVVNELLSQANLTPAEGAATRACFSDRWVGLDGAQVVG
jgi:serine protease Do